MTCRLYFMKMKLLKLIVVGMLAAATVTGFAADKKESKAKPYPLDKCIVTDEKLGEMGEPYVFTHEGQEIKLCCKSCQKDFKKNPAKFLKKIETAGKKSGNSKG